MAEELDLHLLELPRAEGEVPRRDFVPKALAHLGDAEGNPNPRAVADVLEVDKLSLGRLGAEEDGVLLAAQRAGGRLEHQVELPRRGQRAGGLSVRPNDLREIADRAERHERTVPGEIVGVFAAEVEELHGLVLRQFQPFLAAEVAGHKDAPSLARHPAAADLIVAIAFVRLPAIDHEIVEQIVMARTLPDLRVHDDRAIQPDHFVGRGGAGRDLQLVIRGDHVAPPGLADVPFQFHAQRTVVPKALQAAVDLARLEQEPPPLAQGHQLIHFHDNAPGESNDQTQ